MQHKHFNNSQYPKYIGIVWMCVRALKSGARSNFSRLSFLKGMLEWKQEQEQQKSDRERERKYKL